MKTENKMIDSDALKTIVLAFISMFSYLASQFTGLISQIDFMPFIVEEGIIDLILERGARTVAILAGMVAIIRGFQSSNKNRKNKKNENTKD